MRALRALPILALLLLGGLGAQAAPAAELEDLLFNLQLVPLDGQAPHPFTLDGLDGEKVSLGDFRGKPVLLYFWATW